MLGQRPMSQPKVQQSEGVAASLGTVRTVRTVGWDISGPWAFCHQLYRPGLAEGQPGDGQPLLALGSCEAGVDVSATHAGEGPSSRWMQWVCPKYARPIARAFRWHCWGVPGDAGAHAAGLLRPIGAACVYFPGGCP